MMHGNTKLKSFLEVKWFYLWSPSYIFSRKRCGVTHRLAEYIPVLQWTRNLTLPTPKYPIPPSWVTVRAGVPGSLQVWSVPMWLSSCTEIALTDFMFCCAPTASGSAQTDSQATLLVQNVQTDICGPLNLFNGESGIFSRGGERGPWCITDLSLSYRTKQPMWQFKNTVENSWNGHINALNILSI